MPDILLIQPPIEDFYLTAKRTMPYGLAGIGAVLRQAGFSVAILDALAGTKRRDIARPAEMAFLEPYFGRSDNSPFALFHRFRHFGFSYQHLARQAKASGAFLVGISSLFTAYSACALDTAAAVKQACPQARIVMGGHHPTAMPLEVLSHPAVDFVLRGDGEAGLPLLAQALKQGRSLDRIPGLVRKNQPDTAELDPPAVIQDLDRLPLPAFDLVDWGYYQRRGAGSLALATGRGCPMRCTYCAVNAATHHGFRQKSVSRVMAELEAAQVSSPLGFIDFEDEHLSVDHAWFLRLLRAITRRFGPRGVELRAMNGLFAPSLDETLVAHMAQAGFRDLNLALITTDAAQLKRFNRPDITRDLDRVLALSQRYGLKAVVYVIVAGPHQDPHIAIKDLLFLAQRPVLAGVSVFYPAPESADFRWCLQEGLLPPQNSLMRASTLPLAHATDRVQTVTLLRLGRILNFMKYLIDIGHGLPPAAKLPAGASDKMPDRTELGKVLLAAFLNDGEIYGQDDQGQVYPHLVDKTLVKAFLAGLATEPLRGTRA